MNESIAKLIALLFSVLMLGNAIVMRRIVGSWLFPAVMYALFWFALSFLPLAVLYTSPVDPWGTAYLFASTVFFSASALVNFNWARAFALNARKESAEQYFNTPFLWTVFAAATTVSLLCFAINMRTQGFTFDDVIYNSIETAATYSNRRGNADLEFSLAAKIGLALAYLASTTGGLLFGSSRTRVQSALAMAGAFMPALAEMLFESAKGLLFQFIALFFGCVLVTRLFNKKPYLLDASDVRRGTVALAILVPLTVISFLSRGLYGVDDTSLIAQQLPAYFSSYAFGHLYAFSDWFAHRIGMPSTGQYAAEPAAYGYYTFTPLFKMLGSTRTLPDGIFEEVYTNGMLLTTNIYTMFRGLIIDFGILGSLFYSFVSGFVIHLSFTFLLTKRRPLVSIAVFIYVIGYFYSSAFVSLFTYNTPPFSVVLLSLCLYANRRFLPPLDDPLRTGMASQG